MAIRCSRHVLLSCRVDTTVLVLLLEIRQADCEQGDEEVLDGGRRGGHQCWQSRHENVTNHCNVHTVVFRLFLWRKVLLDTEILSGDRYLFDCDHSQDLL